MDMQGQSLQEQTVENVELPGGGNPPRKPLVTIKNFYPQSFISLQLTSFSESLPCS